jgi:MFS family permease
MRGFLRDYRSFSPTARLLMANQLAINIGFYLLMPYLAGHLSGDLRMPAAAVGLVLGARNLSQQGMFAVGGWISDRFGCARPIIAGCALRVVAFTMLGFVRSLAALIAASLLTGLAGALFNPAVRACLAHEAGTRRVEAFAVFNLFYQAGILLGPPLGLLLTGAGFAWACVCAAALFGALTAVQLRHLPRRHPGTGARRPSLLAGWRQAAANRPLLAFTAAMTGAYMLSFQIYLLLPLTVRPIGGQSAVAALFAASAMVGVAGQLRVTAWCRRHLTPHQALTVGVAVMASAFMAPAAAALLPAGQAWRFAAVGCALIAASLLALGSALTYPFEMDAVIAIAPPGRAGTCYGLYSTITGLGITAGNLGTGALVDAAARLQQPWLPWLALAACGALATAAVARVTRAARSPTDEPSRPERRADTNTSITSR